METESSNSKKILIFGVILVIAAFAAYYMFFRTETVEITYDEFGNPITAEVVGQDLIELSAQLETVSFDSEALKKPSFTNLVDYSVALPSGAVGRRNPFSPLTTSATDDSSYDALVAEIIRGL